MGQLVVGVRGNGQALMGETGAGVVEQLGQEQSTLFGVGTPCRPSTPRSPPLQLQAPRCSGNAFVRQPELLFQLTMSRCRGPGSGGIAVHNRILLLFYRIRLHRSSRGNQCCESAGVRRWACRRAAEALTIQLRRRFSRAHTSPMEANAITFCSSMRAQETGIDSVLRQIEANNKELQANAQLISSQKLESRTENNLPDPTLSYAHLWDSKNSDETVGEMVVSQSFDFPTLYITRGKMNRLKTGALDAQAATMRQQILLQAKEVCLDIIMLQHQQELLDARLKNAEELAAMYAKRLATGDANALETNKINLELLNVRTESRMNSTALNNKIKELLVLNGNQPLTPGRPFPDGPAVPTAKALGLTDYPLVPLPTDFHRVCSELLAADPSLQSFDSESAAARKSISASKQGWLPKLELGYRRNTESGHPLNGVVVGFSFPLFSNKGKVKIAKAQAMNIDFQKDNARVKASSELWQLYEEARNLDASMQEYKRTFQEQQDLTLLKQALVGGQISMIEYFVEVSVVYQSKTNLLQLENQYQKAMARIYKNEL